MRTPFSLGPGNILRLCLVCLASLAMVPGLGVVLATLCPVVVAGDSDKVGQVDGWLGSGWIGLFPMKVW